MTASATAISGIKSHAIIPKSLRGAWYSKPSLSKDSEIKFTKYTYTTWYHNHKTIGSSRFKPIGHCSTAKEGRSVGKDYYACLFTEHNKGSAWYAFSVGGLYEVPAMRRTHAYLYDHSGKKYRYPAIESSLRYIFGNQGGTEPQNQYYFKASAWK